jgi:hypothetical protein
MSTTLHQPQGASAAQTLPFPTHTQDDELPDELLEHLHRLPLILPVISISVMALRRQDAESDTDIASVLSQHACEPLDSEIERIECILASRTWRRRQQEVRV